MGSFSAPNTAAVLATLGFSCATLLPAQEAAWSQAQREARPTLKILWSTGEQAEPGPGPAEVTQEMRPALRVREVAGGSVRWFQIVPDTRKFYKNANHPWEADAYKWVGFGKIDYLRREIVEWRGCWEVQLGYASETANPLSLPDGGRFYHPTLGSFWFDTEVLQGNKILRSPGLAEVTDRGMSPSVFRLSIREDDSLVGWLTSYFNVPGLFGCVPWQSENYIGVDCADGLVAAWSRWKKQPMKRDWNVQGIVSEWPRAGEFQLIHGEPAPGDGVGSGRASRRLYRGAIRGRQAIPAHRRSLRGRQPERPAGRPRPSHPLRPGSAADRTPRPRQF